MFYERSDGLPRRWIGMVRHAVSTLGPEVDAVRMVRDYVERLYVPAARGLTTLSAQRRAGRPRRLEGARAQRLERRRGARRRDGAGRRAGRRAPGGAGDGRAGRASRRTTSRWSPSAAASATTTGSRSGTQTRLAPAGTNGAPDAYVFEGEIPLEQAGSFGYAVRVVPHHAALATPAELGLVVWA